MPCVVFRPLVASVFFLVLAGQPAVSDEPPAAFEVRGIVQPLRQITLRSPVDARVIAVHAEVGRAVDGGQVLVEFDPTDLERNRDVAAATLRQADARAMLSGSAVHRAREAQERWRENVELAEEVAERPAGDDGRRRRDGSPPSPIMRAPLEERARERAETVVGRAEAALVRVRMQRSLAEKMRGQLDEADAMARVAQRTAQTVLTRYAKIEAPVGGIVAEFGVTPGERVRTGQELLRLIQTDRLRVLVWVPPRRLPGPGESLHAEIRADGDTRSYEGDVSAISPQPHPRTGQYLAEVELDNPEGRLRPGTLVDARLTPTN